MPPRLTQYRLCPRSRSVRLALAEYGHEVTLLDENPLQWRKGFLAKNPAGEMPVLEYDNGLTLCGAYSISEFIAEEARPGSTVMSAGPPSLLPGNREDRAEIRRLIDWYHGKFDREVTRELLIEKVYSSMGPSGAEGSRSRDLARGALQSTLSLVLYRLSRRFTALAGRRRFELCRFCGCGAHLNRRLPR